MIFLGTANGEVAMLLDHRAGGLPDNSKGV